MATSYPSGIDNFTNPSANDYEDVVSHSGQHANANDAIEAIETTLGTTAGTAVLKNLSAGDFVAKTANETFSGTTSFAEIDIGSSTVVDEVLDEDDMASDSATALVTQQSVKAMHDTGWTAITETLTYKDADEIYFSGDVTAKYQKYDKIKIAQQTDGTKYFYITSVGSYDSGNDRTPVQVTAGTSYDLDNETISGGYFSRIENPLGFPRYFDFTFTSLSASGSMTVSLTSYSYAQFCVIGGVVHLQFRINMTIGGSASTSISLNGLPILPVDQASFPSGGMVMLRDGFALNALINGGSNQIMITKYDGSNLNLGTNRGPFGQVSYLAA